MAFAKLSLALCVWPIVACLALQEAPTRAVNEECEADDWCEEGLVCIRTDGDANPGICAPPGNCARDRDCAAGTLCNGSTSKTLGTCAVNKGCTSNAQCSGGLTCYHGGCWKMCTTSSECGEYYCSEIDCPYGETSCPYACQAL
jgi:hypothetical protein